MSSTTAADVLVETIQAWGVDVVFGMPGDGINGIVESLRTRQDQIRFIQVRHEEAAALMACGYAKYTGRLGCCLATSGPGGIHLLNGLYDAKLDGAPVLALTGLQYHDLLGTHAQQDVELDKVFMDVASFNARIMGPAHVEHLANLACRSALSERTVAHLTFPVDLQSVPFRKRAPSRRGQPGHGHTSAVRARSARLPSEDSLHAAARLLNKGRKVAILAGRGALEAGAELEAAAEALDAPVIKALLGKACLPDDSPYTTGGIGLLGTLPSQEAIEQCDTLLMIGTSFPYLEFLPAPGQARAVQIDLDPRRIGLRYDVEVGLIGDSRRTLQALLPLFKRRRHRGFLKKARRGMQKWRRLMEQRGSDPGKPMKPQVVAWELGKRLSDNAIVSADSGTVATWFARQIEARAGQRFSLSGTLATMANGLPYTIAAQVAYPEHQCVAFVGDGGFSMLMAEFATAAKYQLPIRVIVLKNNSLGMIKWEQMVFLGNPEFGCDLHPIDFSACARACGGVGFRIEDPKECGRVLDRALSTPGPVLVEAVVDPHTPPLPPKTTVKQAAHFARALARGTPNRRKIALTVASDAVREVV